MIRIGIITMEGKQLDKHLKRIGEDIWLIEDDRDNLKLTYRGKEIISSKKSPFQQVDIVDLYDFGKCLVLDGVVQTTVLDGYIYNEMIPYTDCNPRLSQRCSDNRRRRLRCRQ